MTNAADPTVQATEVKGNGWRSRKLWFCLLVVAASTAVLFYSPKVTGDHWLAVVTATVWAYVVGNVGTTAADTMSKVLAVVLGKRAGE